MDRPGRPTRARGLRLVQAGLWCYDAFARDRSLPRHTTQRREESEVPHLNTLYRWVCAYTDAQMVAPERFVVALLQDAEHFAMAHGERFDVLTYHDATLQDQSVTLRDRSGNTTCELKPELIINASGAWVDQTLQQLSVTAPRLIGGTKGSHFVSHHPKLIAALDGRGIYAEAQDGRPVFMLPFGDAALVGTTDVRFEQPPQHATASEEELEYLIAAANQVFPDLNLNREAVAHHYAGIRPLPFSRAKRTAAVSRRHTLHQHACSELPMVSVIGGKLTTCRSLAEEAVAQVLPQIDRQVAANSRDREIPERAPDWKRVVDTPARLQELIQTEWVQTMEDLVERRLLLLNDPNLSRQTLRKLAEALVHAGRLGDRDVETAVARCQQRLLQHFGKTLVDSD